LVRETEDIDTALNWLEEVVSALESLHPTEQQQKARTQAHFSPGDAPREAILRLLNTAYKTVDICVFTITDNILRDALIRTSERGVALRVISDNDKSSDRGSDIRFLQHHNISVVTDRTDAHMHHKFAIFDQRTLLTGSYNWTRSAARENHENVVVTDDNRLVSLFINEFNTLWTELH